MALDELPRDLQGPSPLCSVKEMAWLGFRGGLREPSPWFGGIVDPHEPCEDQNLPAWLWLGLGLGPCEDQNLMGELLAHVLPAFPPGGPAAHEPPCRLIDPSMMGGVHKGVRFCVLMEQVSYHPYAYIC